MTDLCRQKCETAGVYGLPPPVHLRCGQPEGVLGSPGGQHIQGKKRSHSPGGQYI